jgi:hypothetical protein
MASIYAINKGINTPISFKGLKAQYILHLGVVVVGDMILFAILYIIGISSYICVPVALGLGAFLIKRIYRMSHTYGEYGLMKRSAGRSVPKALLSKSRYIFTRLNSNHGHTTR